MGTRWVMLAAVAIALAVVAAGCGEDEGAGSPAPVLTDSTTPPPEAVIDPGPTSTTSTTSTTPAAATTLASTTDDRLATATTDPLVGPTSSQLPGSPIDDGCDQGQSAPWNGQGTMHTIPPRPEQITTRITLLSQNVCPGGQIHLAIDFVNGSDQRVKLEAPRLIIGLGVDKWDVSTLPAVDVDAAATTTVDVVAAIPLVAPGDYWIAVYGFQDGVDVRVGVPSAVPARSSADIVVAGDNGVTVLRDGNPMVITTEPMSLALAAFGDTIVVQRKSGYGDWGASETTPLVPFGSGSLGATWSGGQLVTGWYRLHDYAVVACKPIVLYEIQQQPISLTDTPPNRLFTYDFTSGEHTEIAEVGGWESGSSRYHLAANGLIVGESYASALRSLSVLGMPGAPSVDAGQLGLEDYYDDCTDCPRQYTVSRDGSQIGWLDGNDLVIDELATGRQQRRPLDPSVEPERINDITLDDGFVVLNRAGYEPTLPPVIVDLGTEPPTFAELPGQFATAG